MKQNDEHRLLVRQIGNGDEKAYAKLFDLYFVPLCRFVHLFVPNHQEVEEIVMNLFTNIWKNRKDIQIKISVKAYLFKSARNMAINHLQRTPRKVPLEQLDSEPLEMPEATLENEELHRLIYEAIMNLPVKCRKVFLLSRRDELTHADISRRLSISTKTVEAQISKAIRSIKKYLKNNYFYYY